MFQAFRYVLTISDRHEIAHIDNYTCTMLQWLQNSESYGSVAQHFQKVLDKGVRCVLQLTRRVRYKKGFRMKAKNLKAKIIGGPSKWDIILALFDSQQGSRVIEFDVVFSPQDLLAFRMAYGESSYQIHSPKVKGADLSLSFIVNGVERVYETIDRDDWVIKVQLAPRGNRLGTSVDLRYSMKSRAGTASFF